MRVVACIVSHRPPEVARPVVECVLRTCPEASFLLINSGRDRKEYPDDMFAGLPVLTMHMPINIGHPGGANVGINYASDRGAEFFLFLDDDITILTEDWYEKCLELMDFDKKIGVIGAKILNPDKKTVQWACTQITEDGWNFHRGEPRNAPELNRILRVNSIQSAFFFARMEHLRKVGEWDLVFSPSQFDDADYCFRMWIDGFSCVYDGRIEIVQPPPSVSARDKKEMDLAATAHANFMNLKYGNMLRFGADLERQIDKLGRDISPAKVAETPLPAPTDQAAAQALKMAAMPTIYIADEAFKVRGKKRAATPTQAPRIYFWCPDVNAPTGGMKILYRHVDILNEQGFQAAIVHKQEGFRCSWFENSTEICYVSDLRLSHRDFLALPEFLGREIANIAKGIRKVIYNQNCYYTFLDHPFNPRDRNTPYLSPDITAIVVVSEDSQRYLNHAFPRLTVFRVHNSINPSLFSYEATKRKQICYMPRKHKEDAQQVLNILNLRDALAGFDVVPIENRTEKQVSDILREALVFLSFGFPEGFSLPPAEAMACGCIVIGYHGWGGKEYFKPEFSFPIEAADIIQFATTVERVIAQVERNPEPLLEKAKMASEYILRTYSIQREVADVVKAWTSLMNE